MDGLAAVLSAAVCRGCLVTRLREHCLQPWLSADSVVEGPEAILAEQERLGEGRGRADRQHASPSALECDGGGGALKRRGGQRFSFGKLSQEFNRFLTESAPCLDGEDHKPAAGAIGELWVGFFLVSSSGLCDGAVPPMGFRPRLPAAMEGTSEGDVNCQLDPTKDRQAGGDDLNLSLVRSPGTDIEVPQLDIGLNPCAGLPANLCHHAFERRRSCFNAARPVARAVVVAKFVDVLAAPALELRQRQRPPEAAPDPGLEVFRVEGAAPAGGSGLQSGGSARA